MRKKSALAIMMAAVICLLALCPGLSAAEDTASLPDDFDYIAYSALRGVGDAWINSAEHFQLCCSDEFPFTTIKGDVQPTKDGGIIMCHDPGLTLDDEGKVIAYDAKDNTAIHDLTYKQCMKLTYAKQHNGQDVNVCDFETYISICAEGNKNAYITIRKQKIAVIIKKMMKILRKYHMEDRCIINSFTYDSLALVKKYAPDIQVSWVIGSGLLTKAKVDKAVGLGNCIITLYEFPASRFGGFKTMENYRGVIDYAREQGITLYAAIVESGAYTPLLKQMGISGAQFAVNPLAAIDDRGESAPLVDWTEDNSVN